MLARLKHPNVVSLLGFAEHPHFRLVLELAELGCVQDLLAVTQIQDPKLFMFPLQLDLLQQISAGMIYLHDNRVVHRDLSKLLLCFFEWCADKGLRTSKSAAGQRNEGQDRGLWHCETGGWNHAEPSSRRHTTLLGSRV